MDWIMQFAASEDILIVSQSSIGEEPQVFKARELMPHYPR
jgi:hypothetical protein